MAAPKIGVFLPTMWERDGAPVDVVAAARHIEALGLDSAWAVDQLVAGTGVPFTDSTVALTAAAAVTRDRRAHRRPRRGRRRHRCLHAGRGRLVPPGRAAGGGGGAGRVSR